MPDWHRCARCAAFCSDAPDRPSAPDARRDVPDGYTAAFHLCCDCVRELQAKRSELYGWTYRVPTRTKAVT